LLADTLLSQEDFAQFHNREHAREIFTICCHLLP